MSQLYFLPLGQADSVEVVLHVLMNGHECDSCPAKAYCRAGNQPCYLIGSKVTKMWQAGELPSVGTTIQEAPPKAEPAIKPNQAPAQGSKVLSIIGGNRSGT